MIATCVHLTVDHDADNCVCCTIKRRRKQSKKTSSSSSASSSSSSLYSNRSYWDKRYASATSTGGRNEWFVDFNTLEDIFTATLPTSMRSALEIGCGMSLLSEELLKHQVANKVTSIDFSEPAIQHMVERQATNVEVVSALQGSSVEYLCMDATKLKFEDNSFDLVVEKGTLDALLTDEESQFSEKVEEGDGSSVSSSVSSVSSASSNSSDNSNSSNSSNSSGIVASVQARALLREARRVLSDDGIFIVVSHSDNRAVVIAEEGFHVEGPTKVVNGKASYYAYVCT